MFLIRGRCSAYPAEFLNPDYRVEVTAAARPGRPRPDRGDRLRRGIPPQLLERIFGRFYRVDLARTHSPQTGSGIGLIITRAIVHAHGGEIRAHSQRPATAPASTSPSPPYAAADRVQDETTLQRA